VLAHGLVTQADAVFVCEDGEVVEFNVKPKGVRQ
jgi:hypothetical protein